MAGATAPCPCCHGPLDRALATLGGGARVRRCRSCGSAAVVAGGAASEPEARRGGGDRRGAAAAAPAPDYYRHRENLDIHAAPAVVAERAPRWRRWLRRVAADGGAGRLLDVGCGPGSFLVVAREMCWDAAGCDVAPAAVRAARAAGLDVRRGSPEQLEPPPRRLDLITAWDVIEHLEDPRVVLAAAARMLRPGGALLAEVPREDVAARALIRWAAILSRGALDGRSLIYHADHRVVPSRAGLEALMREVGLTVVALERAATGPSLLAAKARAFHPGVPPAALRLVGRVAGTGALPGLGNKLVVLARRS